MELPDLSRMSPQEFFKWLDGVLGKGWICGLVSSMPGLFRIQLHDGGDIELGWRKCIEAPTLEGAVKAAIEFTHQTTVEEYQKQLLGGITEQEGRE